MAFASTRPAAPLHEVPSGRDQAFGPMKVSMRATSALRDT